MFVSMLLVIGTLFSQVQDSKSVETTTKGHKLSNKDKVEKHRKEVRQKPKKEAYPSDEVLVLVSIDSDSDSQEQIELKIQAVESVIPGTVKHHIRLSGDKHSRKRSKSYVLRVQLPKGKTVKQAIDENFPETAEKSAEALGQSETQPTSVMENKLNDLVYRLGVMTERVSNILQRLRV